MSQTNNIIASLNNFSFNPASNLGLVNVSSTATIENLTTTNILFEYIKNQKIQQKLFYSYLPNGSPARLIIDYTLDPNLSTKYKATGQNFFFDPYVNDIYSIYYALLSITNLPTTPNRIYTFNFYNISRFNTHTTIINPATINVNSVDIPLNGISNITFPTSNTYVTQKISVISSPTLPITYLAYTTVQCVNVTDLSYKAVLKTYYAYTGVDQTVSIPTGITKAYIQCWGAGGATSGFGGMGEVTGSSGGGGYTDAYFSVSSYVGTSLKVIVGGGGKFANYGVKSDATYGGGGSSGPTNYNFGSSSGGGRSAVRLYVSSSYVEIITAGGGGGGGSSYNILNHFSPICDGGPGGGLIGGDAHQLEGGKGGTQTAGGAAGDMIETDIVNPFGTSGSQYTGGSGKYPAGGGGGWYGGGAGGVVGIYDFGGGGGGSSYINSNYTNSSEIPTMIQGAVPTVANNAGLPSNVRGTIGNGETGTGTNVGSANGKDGYVIITFI